MAKFPYHELTDDDLHCKSLERPFSRTRHTVTPKTRTSKFAGPNQAQDKVLIIAYLFRGSGEIKCS
jgi:hypothetical protein